MEAFVDLIESYDVGALIFLILMLCSIGAKMIEGNARLHRWGLRLAIVASVAYCLYVGPDIGSSDPVDWLGIIFRGLFAGGLTLGASWIVLALCSFAKGIANRVRGTVRDKLQARQDQRDQLRAEQQRQRQQQEWERSAPERARQAQLEAARTQQAKHLQMADQQQRDSLRYACELTYNLHAPMIGKRFSYETMQRFIEQYMDDRQPVSVVRQRANQLRHTIQQHLDAVQPTEQPTTLADLANWFRDQKSQIESLRIDESFKQDYLVSLNERYGELTQQLMERLTP